MREITFQIQRFDGNQSYMQEYNLPFEPGKTILGCLIKIKEELDPTLSFTSSCRSAICGACGVKVNGLGVLACETPLETILTRYKSDIVKIGPMGNFPVIRDLVVDWEPSLESMKAVKPWIIPHDEFSAEKGCKQSDEQFHKIVKYSDCILCGACVSECSKRSHNSNDFLEPFVFVKAQKYVADSRDKAELEHLSPAIKEGLWKCFHCEQCVAKCPKQLEPAEDIAKLRVAAFKKALTDNPGARHALTFLDDIQTTGRLNEAQLALKTEGIFKSITRLPFALRLMKTGKLNPFHSPKPVKGIEQVRIIIKAAKEEAQK